MPNEVTEAMMDAAKVVFDGAPFNTRLCAEAYLAMRAADTPPVEEVERLREALRKIADGEGVDWAHKPANDLQDIALAALRSTDEVK